MNRFNELFQQLLAALAQVSIQINIPLEQQYQRSTTTTTTVYGQGNMVIQERRQVPQKVCENRWINGQTTTFCTTQFVEVSDPHAYVPETVYQPRVINTQPSVNGYPGLQLVPQAPRYELPQYQPGIRIEIRK